MARDRPSPYGEGMPFFFSWRGGLSLANFHGKRMPIKKIIKKRDFFAMLVYTILKHDEIEAKRNARAK